MLALFIWKKLLCLIGLKAVRAFEANLEIATLIL